MSKKNQNSLAIFENFKIRRHYDEKTETWFFSVVDIIQILIQQPDYQVARKYWNKLKERPGKGGSQSETELSPTEFQNSVNDLVFDEGAYSSHDPFAASTQAAGLG